LEPVSHVNQVLLLLRKQLSERAGKSAATLKRAPSSTAGPAPAELPLSELLARRVGDLRAAGLADERALSRVLLEEVLLAELGRHLHNEPAFQRIVDDVQAGLEDDALLREALHSLVASQE
jgi:hypothetical protein